MAFDRAAARERLGETAARASGDRLALMRAASDALWDAYGPEHGGPVSWIGFYEPATETNNHGAEPGEAMVLGPHRDKPACSPIGLHGACGQVYSGGRSMIVTDVANLGEGYVACDPKDLAELVIPMFDDSGAVWGVLDADSFERGAFTGEDLEIMRSFCEAIGLSAAGHGRGEAITV